MANAGRVAIVPKGDWNANVEYERLNAVAYNNTLYLAKKAVPIGTMPTDTEYYMKCIVGGAGAIATTEDAGIVKAGEDINVDDTGEMSLKTDFTVQEELAELTGDEDRKTLFGKVAKVITDFIAHKTLKATASVLGHVKISNSAAITTEGEYALDAVEKNASVDGTLAYQIAQQNDNLIVTSISITKNSNMSAGNLILKKQGNLYNFSGTFVLTTALTSGTVELGTIDDSALFPPSNIMATAYRLDSGSQYCRISCNTEGKILVTYLGITIPQGTWFYFNDMRIL